MEIAKDSLQQLDKMLAFLDGKIKAGTVTADTTHKIQTRLDLIDKAHHAHERQSKYYQQMLELQALLHFQEGREVQGREFLQEAYIHAGSVESLQSSVLRRYTSDIEADSSSGQSGTAGDWSLLDDKQQRFMRSYDIKPTTQIRFFVRNAWLFTLYTVLTFGLYDLYWFCRNWVAIRDATGQKMRPFWRAVFAIFYVWPLFKIIRLQARQHGYRTNAAPAGRLALLYIIISYASLALSRAPEYSLGYLAADITLSLLTVIILLAVQRAAAYNNAAALPSEHSVTARHRPIEMIYTVIATIVMVASVVLLLVSGNSTTLSTADQSKADGLSRQIDNLTSQYTTCSNDLTARQNSVDTSSQAAVDSYNTDLNNCEAVRQQQNAVVNEYNALIGAD